MKRLRLFAVLSLACMTSCIEQTPNKGEVSVLKDGTPWEVRIFADKEDDRFNVTLTEETPSCILGQLTIHDIPAQIGVYELNFNPFSAIHLPTIRYHTSSCDVLLKSYETKDSTDFSNYVEITKVRNNCITGKFEVMLSFVGNENDTIRFTEGIFDTKIIR